MSNIFDVSTHLIETYSRLNNTIRYSTHPKFYHESVSSHSFFVTYIAMLLCDTYFKDVDKSRVLTMALIHDVEESLTGDIIYTTKHKNLEFSDAVKVLNETIIKEIYLDRNDYLEVWDECKQLDTKESRIVEVADRMSALLFLYGEISLGNKALAPMFFGNLELIRKQNFCELDKMLDDLERKFNFKLETH